MITCLFLEFSLALRLLCNSHQSREQYTSLHYPVGSARVWPASPREQFPKERKSEGWTERNYGRAFLQQRRPPNNGGRSQTNFRGRIQTTVDTFLQR